MDKSSFILYTDYFEQLELLSMEQRGVLLTACMMFQLGRELPEMDDFTKMAYLFISADMRRNNTKYEGIIEQRKKAGRKGGFQKQANLANLANATFAKQNKQSLANLADNDNENVNDNDNDNEKDNENVDVNDTLPQTPSEGAESESDSTPTLSDVIDYCRERGGLVDAEEFYDFYTSKGWLIGHTPMQDWKAAFRGWERNHKAKDQPDRYADIDDWARRRKAENDS